jgi:hypothetical protein
MSRFWDMGSHSGTITGAISLSPLSIFREIITRSIDSPYRLSYLRFKWKT